MRITQLRVRATFIAAKKEYVLHIQSICSLRYPACNAHASYCHLWLEGLQYFSKLSHKRQVFEKKNIQHKTCSLIFSMILSEIFLILRRLEGDMMKNVF